MEGNYEDEELQTVLSCMPDDEDYQIFREWCRYIRQSIDKSKFKPNVRKELHQIFTEIEIPIKERAAFPSQADIGRSLGFKSPKISSRMKQLRELVEIEGF